MDFLLGQLFGFADALAALVLDPWTNLYLIASVFLGIVVCALPGLTATLAVTILTGFFGNKIPLDYALIALLGAYVGAIYGGSCPSILLNIPGTAASAATAMDGYPLAKEGRGAEALGLTPTASCLGTLVGTVAFLIFVWVLLLFSKSIASPEKALLALFEILLSRTLMSEDLAIKGRIAGLLGLALAMVGMDPILSEARYSFGWSYLLSGVAVVPVLKGAFAIPRITEGLRHVETGRMLDLQGRILPNWRAVRRYLPTIGRSGVIGTGVGALPGPPLRSRRVWWR